MKLSTLEQLTDAVERIASKLDSQESSQVDLSNYLTKAEASNTFLTKAEASDTYATKSVVVFGSEQDVVNKFGIISSQPGAVWIDFTDSQPRLATAYQGYYWYLPFTKGGRQETPPGSVVD